MLSTKFHQVRFTDNIPWQYSMSIAEKFSLWWYIYILLLSYLQHRKNEHTIHMGFLVGNSNKSLTHLPLDKMATILADDNFKCIFLNEKDRIPIRISQ